MSNISLSLREEILTRFAITSHHIPSLTLYKRLNWSASYFMAQWESNIGTYAAGTIRRYNHMFHVQFCPSCSIGQIKQKLSNNPNLQLALSFRKISGMPAYVIVDFQKGEY